MEQLTIRPIPLFKVIDRFGKPKMLYLFGFGEDINTCCYIWYIEGAGEKILVDGGATVETVVKRGRPKETITPVQTMEEGLAKFGLKPEDIDTVIVTHLHWDHIELARKFVNARFIVQEDELNTALNPQYMGEGYMRELFEGLNFEVVKGDTRIMEGIEVLLTPGHTVGGQSVAVKTEKGTAVIAGFCSVRENFEPPEAIREKTPFIVPGIHLSVPQASESILKVKRTADIIVPPHEFEYTTVDSIP
jgi:N-acyl homoserine lactone hydrolase